MKPDVSIIIVTYNSEECIEKCLHSLMAERIGVAQEIIVVDNNSRDGTCDVIRKRFPDIKLVTPGSNLGFAAGVNLGVSVGRGEFVLLVNPDTVILNHAVDVILSFARRHPGHGLYGGRTVRPDGGLEPSSCWGEPTLWSMALFGLGITTLFPRNRWLDPESLGSWARDSVREVGVVTGCFLLAQRSVWIELGGLDERYFMYGEDVDLAIRARRLGYRPIICPSAELIHEVGRSSETQVHKVLLLYRGKASLVRCHWSGLKRALGLFFLAFGTGIRAGISVMLRDQNGHESASRWRFLWRERADWMQGYSFKSEQPLG